MGSKGNVIFAVLGYATCSSLMLVVNKVCVHVLPAPSFVLLMQVATAALSVKAVGVLGFVEVDELELPKLKSFFFVSCAFLGCIFTNIKTLQYCNVETFIVFRASTPVIIGVADWLILGRELPNTRSALSMMALVVGAGAYMATDSSYEVHGYRWVFIWYCTFCFDQLYIKHVVDAVQVRSNWGRVFYTNLWSAVLLTGMVLVLEPHVLTKTSWSPEQVAALALSCALGTAMSYFAFLCRAAVSATSFTVIGNVCKITTVLINILIWDKHASPLGILFLLACLVAAGAYQQAPLRTEKLEPTSTALIGGKDGDAEEGEVATPPAK